MGYHDVYRLLIRADRRWWPISYHYHLSVAKESAERLLAVWATMPGRPALLIEFVTRSDAEPGSGRVAWRSGDGG